MTDTQIRHTCREWATIFREQVDESMASEKANMTQQEYRDAQKKSEELKLGRTAKVELSNKDGNVHVTFKSFGLRTDVTVATLVNALKEAVRLVPERPLTLKDLKEQAPGKTKKEKKKWVKEQMEKRSVAQDKINYDKQMEEFLRKTLVVCRIIESEVTYNLNGGPDEDKVEVIHVEEKGLPDDYNMTSFSDDDDSSE